MVNCDPYFHSGWTGSRAGVVRYLYCPKFCTAQYKYFKIFVLPQYKYFKIFVLPQYKYFKIFVPPWYIYITYKRLHLRTNSIVVPQVVCIYNFILLSSKFNYSYDIPSYCVGMVCGVIYLLISNLLDPTSKTYFGRFEFLPPPSPPGHFLQHNLPHQTNLGKICSYYFSDNFLLLVS